jgi:hypothetical protein
MTCRRVLISQLSLPFPCVLEAAQDPPTQAFASFDVAE